MNDIMIALAYRGRMRALNPGFCFELAEAHPGPYQRFIDGRYFAALFSGPAWGWLFETEKN